MDDRRAGGGLMCGVAACAGDASTVALMTVLLDHRGPDSSGVVSPRRDVALGHARLSVIDLDARSACPMTRGPVTLVYNGECWNYLSLREELAARGETFSTTGDTEVVCTALRVWGVQALSRIEGMFALLWWDEREEALFAARDRFGEVPLHVAALHDRVIFSSELKAMGESRRVADWVLPGTLVRVSKAEPFGWRADRHRWYDAPSAPSDHGREEAAALVRAEIANGCAERAVSDVPVCTLLSGGIDSTAVAWHLRDHVPGLVAYTAVMDPKGADVRKTRLAAAALEIPLVEVTVPAPTADDLREVVRQIEMPHKAQVEIGWSCLKLAEAMRADGFKVVFSGEGSDELWASYDSCWHDLRAGAEWHAYRKQLFVEQHRKNFARVNKIFMAHGVEGRLPFLHTRLVELALSVSAAACFDKRPIEKQLIKAAYRGVLPDEIVDRPKMAFQIGNGSRDVIARTVENPRAVYGAEYRRVYA